MQKRRASAAIRLLTRALPDEFSVDPPTPDDSAAFLQLRPPTGRTMDVWLVESPDTPVPAGGVRVVVVDDGGAEQHDHYRRAGLSFVDLTGVVRLEAPGLYIDRQGLKPAEVLRARRTGVDPYKDRASRVVRALLMSVAARRWTTSGLASAAEVDVSTASRVVKELRRRGLVLDEAPGQGRASRIGLVDPSTVLRDWTRRYSWEDNAQLRVAAPMGAVSRFLPRLAGSLRDYRWALSLQAGASLIAPHAEFDIVHVYVDASVEGVAAEQGWEPSPSGRLVLMEPRYRNSAWFQARRFNDLHAVGPVQLVLDLWHYPVRGREQAEHMVDTVLRPIWQRDEHGP